MSSRMGNEITIESNHNDSDLTEEQLLNIFKHKQTELDELNVQHNRLRVLREEKESLGNQIPKSNETALLALSTLKQELAAARDEIALLRKVVIQNPKVEIESKEWNGECDYNHPGLVVYVKSLHKKYKDINLPRGFDFNSAFLKGELSEYSLIWTNLCTILRILDSSTATITQENIDTLAIVLNICRTISKKRNYTVVKNTTQQ